MVGRWRVCAHDASFFYPVLGDVTSCERMTRLMLLPPLLLLPLLFLQVQHDYATRGTKPTPLNLKGIGSHFRHKKHIPSGIPQHL